LDIPAKTEINFIYNNIHNAFLNEISLERNLSEKHHVSNNYLPFKVLQFSSYFSKPGFFYYLFIYLFCVFVILFQFLIGFTFSVLYVFRFFISFNIPINLIVSSKSFRSVTLDVIKQLELSEEQFTWASLFNLTLLVRRIRLIQYLPFIIGFMRYVILFSDHVFLVFLHFKDLLKLYLIHVHIIDNQKLVVLTEDHYQRFAYSLSNLECSKFIIFQHGFIDDSIKFPCRFGKIDCLFIRDFSFLRSFKNYYEVRNYFILHRNAELIFSDRDLAQSCFLASSSPFIDSEIDFARLFKSKFDLPLVIKKHPKHFYSREKIQLLLGYADEVWNDEFVFPNSCIFISYGSFLEFEYKSAGSFTFKLSDYPKIEDLFEDVQFIKALELEGD